MGMSRLQQGIFSKRLARLIRLSNAIVGLRYDSDIERPQKRRQFTNLAYIAAGKNNGDRCGHDL